MKKNIKKILSTLLVASFITTGLAACGSNDNSANADKADKSKADTQAASSDEVTVVKGVTGGSLAPYLYVGEDGELTGIEGCLSVPGKTGIVTRPNYVKVVALEDRKSTRLNSSHS